jgi:hypothetical protein
MSKRSGFAVKITAFIEADPKNAAAMASAADIISERLERALQTFRCVGIKVDSRFMLSKDIPDPAPVADTTERSSEGSPGPAAGAVMYSSDPLDIPPALDRRGKA